MLLRFTNKVTKHRCQGDGSDGVVTLVMVTLVMVLVVMVLLTVKQVLLVVSLCYKWRHRCGHSDSCEQSSDPSPVSIYIPISIQYTTTRSIKLSMYLTAQ